MLTNASCVFHDVDRTCWAVVHSDCYVITIVFLHTTPAYPNPWNSACYIMITVDRGSTSTIHVNTCMSVFAFASTSPSKFNVASMVTQTQTHRMDLNPFSALMLIWRWLWRKRKRQVWTKHYDVMFPCKHYLTFHRVLFDSTDQRRLHAWLRSVCSSSSSSCVRSWVGWSWWRVGPITRRSKAPRSSSKLKRSWCKNSRRRNTDLGWRNLSRRRCSRDGSRDKGMCHVMCHMIRNMFTWCVTW